jgi:hypothetical protein
LAGATLGAVVDAGVAAGAGAAVLAGALAGGSGSCGLKMYGVRKRTAPMSTKAMISRVSMENSFFPVLGVGWLALLAGSLMSSLDGAGLSNGVESARVEWVTAGEASQPKPDAADGAVLAHRFLHVLRTTWIVTAGRRQ